MPQISLQYRCGSHVCNRNRNKKSSQTRCRTRKIVTLLSEPLGKLATEMSQNLKRCIAFFCAWEWKPSLVEIPAISRETSPGLGKLQNVTLVHDDDVRNAALVMNLNLRLYSISREPSSGHSKLHKCNLHPWWGWQWWCHYRQWWWCDSSPWWCCYQF